MTLAAVVALGLIQGGLSKIDVVTGTGAVAEPGDTVTVLYKGNLQNGKVFDSSEDKPPFVFVLGKGQVIKGWDDGVVGMRVGGQRMLSVPPELAYGEKAIADLIPAKSALIFDIKLLRVDKEKDKPEISVDEIQAGVGASAEEGKTAIVHYKGMFLNGKVFDESYSRKLPIEVKLGAKQVIPGFEQGLKGLKVGGKRKVTIPYALAYGEQGRPPRIPARSTLVFELELVEIK